MAGFQTKIVRFDSLPSTNTEAARQAMAGAPEGLVIVAGEQTAGRGRMDRKWISPAGAGLYSSTLLRPRIDASLWSLIPLLAALAVHDALVASCALETDIKWPNDILVEDRKLCGILAETVETGAGRAVIVGIGINIKSLQSGVASPESVTLSLTRDSRLVTPDFLAISIQDATGATPNAEALLDSLIGALVARYESFQTSVGPAELISEWTRRSTYANGKRVSVAGFNESFEGTTRGLESDGALRVETDSGEIKVVRAGDVTSVRPSHTEY